jgi:hypothetical protein
VSSRTARAIQRNPVLKQTNKHQKKKKKKKKTQPNKQTNKKTSDMKVIKDMKIEVDH